MRFRGEEPETRFRIAPAGPEAVAEAYQTYTRVAAEYEAAKSKLAALPDEARAAVNAAHEAQAAARVAGSAPPKEKPSAIQAKFDAEIAKTRDDVAALSTATDDAGNALAEAIVANRQAWLDQLELAEDDASARLRKLIGEVRSAVAELADARSAPRWVQEFNLRDAKAGMQAEFASSELSVVVPRDRSVIHDTPVAKVIGLLELVSDPPAPPKPRTLKRAKDSSMAPRPERWQPSGSWEIRA